MSPRLPQTSSGPADRTTAAVAIAVATLVSFLTPFMGSSINVALPSISREFGMDAVQLGLVPTVYLLAAAMFLVPAGRIADIYGRKRVLTAGVVLYTVASLLCALATSGGFLIWARVMQGCGGAMIFGTNVAILASVVPPGRRGAALGINVGAVYLGLSIGPTLGGILTQQLGWRSIFQLNVVLGILIAGAILWKIRGEWAEARGESFDLMGSLLYGLTLVGVMYGLSRLPDRSGAWWVVGGLGAAAAFVSWELRVESPVLNLRLLVHNRVFALSNLAALINYAATYAVGFILSLFLQFIKGLSPQEAGLVLVIQPAVQCAVSPLAGRLSDRLESRLIASAGMGLTVVALVLLTFLHEGTPVRLIVGPLVLLGCGFGLFSSPNTNAVMASVDRGQYGVASALLGTMRLLGQMLSMGMTLLAVSLFVGRITITPEASGPLVDSLQTVFSVSAVLCVLGTCASLARGRGSRASRRPGR